MPRLLRRALAEPWCTILDSITERGPYEPQGPIAWPLKGLYERATRRVHALALMGTVDSLYSSLLLSRMLPELEGTVRWLTEEDSDARLASFVEAMSFEKAELVKKASMGTSGFAQMLGVLPDLGHPIPKEWTRGVSAAARGWSDLSPRTLRAKATYGSAHPELLDALLHGSAACVVPFHPSAHDPVLCPHATIETDRGIPRDIATNEIPRAIESMLAAFGERRSRSRKAMERNPAPTMARERPSTSPRWTTMVALADRIRLACKARAPDHLWPITGLASRAATLALDIAVLVQNGLPAETPTLVRALMEVEIQIKWMLGDDSGARLDEYVASLNGVRTSIARALNLGDLPLMPEAWFPGRQRRPDRWTVQEKAREADLEHQYDIIYWCLSSHVHVSPMSVVSFHPAKHDRVLCLLFACRGDFGDLPLAYPLPALHVFELADRVLDLQVTREVESAWEAEREHLRHQAQRAGVTMVLSEEIEQGSTTIGFADGSLRTFGPKPRKKRGGDGGEPGITGRARMARKPSAR